MLKKYFSKNTPPMRGRVRVTVETDAVYIREIFQLIGDAPIGLTRLIRAVRDNWAEIEKLLDC